MTIEQQSHTEASIVTTLVMVLLFLFMWLIIMDVPAIEEDEGIEISFGNSATGGGIPSGIVAPATEPAQPVSPPPSSGSPSNNDLMTQEDESDVQLREEQDKAKKAREEAMAEQRRREQEQREQEQRDKEARERAEAERLAKEQQARDKASQFGSLFGQTDNPDGANGGSRESASSGTKGNPLGHGISGGNEWKLGGRSLSGDLPKPSNNFKQEGKVVVNITVDANGKVIQARAGQGTTISDEATKQLAVKAALQARFNTVDRPDKQMGTITFTFKFN